MLFLVFPTQIPSLSPSLLPTAPTLSPTITSSPSAHNYDDKASVTTVFGTGRATTTDSPGLIGEINTPMDAIFSVDENYLYLTDLNGGGLLRKLVVTNSGVSISSLPLYGVKAVFTGLTLCNYNYLRLHIM